MRFAATTPLICILAAALSACPGQPDQATDLPETKQAEIRIEGHPESMTLRRFRPSDDFALPFVTYVPADMRADTVDSGQGKVVRIRAAFGGEPVDAAALHIAAFPPETDARQAEDWTRELARGITRGGVSQDREAAWGRVTYRLSGDRLGFVTLVGHESRWLYILAAYPPEFGDGMAPRIDVILDHWRWIDTGKPLR